MSTTTWFRSALAAGLIALLSGRSEAATYRVPGDAPTIGAGMDRCAPGDTILVAPGTYSGDGNRDLHLPSFDLVLASEGGSAVTVVDCQGSQEEDHVFLYMAGGHTRATVISGFTVRRGSEYGAISMAGDDSPVIRGCTFQNCYGPWKGACITCLGDRVRALITDCMFYDNAASQAGAIYCGQGSAPEISACVFFQNHCAIGFGGAITCEDTAENLQIHDCIFRENSGGALFGSHTYLAVIANCEFFGNANVRGGAVYWDSRLRIVGSTIADNSSDESGGGINFWGTLLEIERCVLWGNCALTGNDLECSQGTVRFTCSALDESGLHVDHTGEVQFNGPQVRSDPRFCDGRTCRPGATGDDYSLRSDSPCLPEFSPCQEQIGALGLGCQAPEPVGACCLGGPGGTCSLLSAGDCTTQQGNYMGDGVSCYPDPCVPIAVETTTWGRIKAQFSR